MLNTTVRELLRSKPSQHIWTISPSESVYDAISEMARHNIGALLVIEANQVVGIVTERDYARKVILANRRSRETKVSEIMASQVIYVSPEYTVDNCMALITAKRVRHLPVLEGNALIGMISIGDVLKTMLADQEFMIEQLTQYVTDSQYQAEPQRKLANG